MRARRRTGRAPGTALEDGASRSKRASPAGSPAPSERGPQAVALDDLGRLFLRVIDADAEQARLQVAVDADRRRGDQRQRRPLALDHDRFGRSPLGGDDDRVADPVLAEERSEDDRAPRPSSRSAAPSGKYEHPAREAGGRRSARARISRTSDREVLRKVVEGGVGRVVLPRAVGPSTLRRGEPLGKRCRPTSNSVDTSARKTACRRVSPRNPSSRNSPSSRSSRSRSARSGRGRPPELVECRSTSSGAWRLRRLEVTGTTSCTSIAPSTAIASRLAPDAATLPCSR